MEAERPKRRALEQIIFKRPDELLKMVDNEDVGVGLDASLEKNVHHGVPSATQMPNICTCAGNAKGCGGQLWGIN